MKGVFGIAMAVIVFGWALVVGVIGVLGYLLYTIITKPELLNHWIKVVTG